MSARQIVVIGASSGGIEALRALVADLPAGFPAPICVVLHMSADSPGLLAEILNRVSSLPVEKARSGRSLHPGRLYVAPPDCHLLVEPGKIRVTRGSRENGFRPARQAPLRSRLPVRPPGLAPCSRVGQADG